MKKRILIIGNNDGLPGVNIDIDNYESYFKSMKGGEWDDSEIDILLNPSSAYLIRQIRHIKELKLDYLIIVFSGHGGMIRRTVLEINPSGELFNESNFDDLAVRQVTIFDCCRALLEPTNEGIEERVLYKSLGGVISTRYRFEKRILQALPQQIKLYACSEGEYSYDTPKGGIYTFNLLKHAKEDDSEFVYFGNAHARAALTVNQRYPNQNPEIILPRLLTQQQLILGIN